ncbi:hypothetical protein ACH5A7_31890 [Streptomyces sp. NPDC018955]|uniref:hypothetical protein n=1 Tax=Streptomyces sp. NPDC018955 TaxID=3365055 RepID=UPI0037B339A3
MRTRRVPGAVAVAASAVIIAGIAAIAVRHPGERPVPRVSGDRMVRLLVDRLPAGGAVRDESGSASDSRSGPGAELTYDRGDGSFRIALAVTRLATPVAPNAADCPDRAHFPYEKCAVTVLPDRSRLMTSEGYEDPLDPSSRPRWIARLVTPGGRQVEVGQWSPRPADANGARTTPPLSPAQLRAVVEAPQWAEVVKALPVPQAAAPPAAPVTDRPLMLRLIRDSLPPSVRVTEEAGATRGYAVLTLDDGRGAHLMTVTAQRWRRDSPEMEQIFADASVRRDGVRVVTRRTAAPRGGRGEVRWEADVLRPDGLRISVSTLNSTAFGLPPTRRTPSLTMEQLTAIASDDAWESG